MTATFRKHRYCVPQTELSAAAPDMLCESLVEGGLEDLTEEEWTF